MAYGLDILADPGMSWSSGDDALFGGGPSDPLSIRLNNPGAIRRSGVQWAGMRPEQGSPFVDFETPEDGIRAMGRLLDTYGSKYGLSTVSGILNRWAPPSENDTRSYASTVAKAIGVSPDQPLDLSDPRVKSALMAAMARVEAGKAHYTQDQIMAALSGQPAPNSGAPKMAEYDIDQGLANMGQMAERVGQMQPPMPSPQGAGNQPMGPNPYLYLAAQLMPQRKGGGWGEAALAAGAAMMQSNRPDFLGGVGAGLQAANQSMARDEEQRYRDQVGTLDLGLKMAQLGQKEAKQPLIKEFKEGDRIVTKQWNGAMWVPLADAPAYRPDKPGEVETLIRLAGIDPESSAGRAMAARILERKAKGEDGGPFPGSSIDASSYNNMIAYNEKVRTGQPTTPQEDMAYSIAYQHASKPTRWQTPDGAMYEAPGIDVSGMVPPKVGAPSPAAVPSTARQTMPPTASAGQPEQRPTGAAVGSQPGTRQIVPPDEKPVAGDSAGRFALVPEARQALEQAQTAYFPDGKSFDRTLAGVAWANVPGTRGAEVFNAVSRAIANRLRIESGAAAPPAEVEAMVKRYLPAPWDSDELARQKLEGLKQYFDAFATSATKGAGPAIREEGRAPPRAAQQPANDMPPPEAFATMDRAAIDQLTPRVSDMTDAQLRALHARRRVLLGISPGSGMTGEGGAP